MGACLAFLFVKSVMYPYVVISAMKKVDFQGKSSDFSTLELQLIWYLPLWDWKKPFEGSMYPLYVPIYAVASLIVWIFLALLDAVANIMATIFFTHLVIIWIFFKLYGIAYGFHCKNFCSSL